jgi:hypothetical protein
LRFLDEHELLVLIFDLIESFDVLGFHFALLPFGPLPAAGG